MKKAFAALLVVSALVIGFTFHATQNATFTNPDPTAIIQVPNM
jgi:hypothetical protein